MYYVIILVSILGIQRNKNIAALGQGSALLSRLNDKSAPEGADSRELSVIIKLGYFGLLVEVRARREC
jgi:hypothetical protein